MKLDGEMILIGLEERQGKKDPTKVYKMALFAQGRIRLIVRAQMRHLRFCKLSRPTLLCMCAWTIITLISQSSCQRPGR